MRAFFSYSRIARVLSYGRLALAMILMLGLNASASLGDDEGECPSESGKPISEQKLEALLQPQKERNWWAATAKQVQNAPCHRKAPFSDAEIEKELTELIPRNDVKIRKEVFGLQLEDSAHLIGLLENLLRFNPPVLAESDAASGQKSFTSECKTVLCAAKDPKIFGPKLGPRLLFMLGRYGFNGSEHSYADTSRWMPKEIDDVLVGLSDYPPAVLPLEKSYPLTHFKRGQDTRTLANAVINVFDTWDGYNAEYRQETILHEVGHVISNRYKLEHSVEWLSFSGWTERYKVKGGKTTVELVVQNPSAVPSGYGLTNPAEDFAESVVAYRYNPKDLLARSPEKYAFLKETVFDGLEYISEEACQGSRSRSHQILERAVPASTRLLSNPNTAMALTQTAIKNCAQELVNQFDSEFTLTESGLERIRPCLEASVTMIAAAEDPAIRNLKFRSEAEKPVLDRLRGRQLDPAGMAKLQRRTRDQLESHLTRYLTEVEKSETLLNENTSSPGNYCERASRYAYQYAESALKSDLVDRKDDFFFYKNRAFYNGFTRQICLKLHNGKSPITASSPEQIQAAVRKHLPPVNQ